jgi:UPF0716 protein FxsA
VLVRQRLGWLGIGAVALLLVEIFVFVLVAQLIGTLWALLLVIATSALGGWLLRREGARAWRVLRQTAGTGQPVGDGATAGAVGLVAALLLVIPGFLTDLAGLALLAPPVRRLVGSGVRRFAENKLPSATAGDIFGPRRVRVRRSTPTPPAAGTTGPVEGEVLEGEVIDPR